MARVVQADAEPIKTGPSYFFASVLVHQIYSQAEKRKNGDRLLFGEWQTEPYEPKVASNGLVPKNEVVFFFCLLSLT